MKQLWERDDWPSFRWQSKLLLPKLRTIGFKQGVLVGKSHGFDRGTRTGFVLDTLSANALSTARLEGIKLDRQQVRRALAVEIGSLSKESAPLVFPLQVESLCKLVCDCTFHFEHHHGVSVESESDPTEPQKSILNRDKLQQWLNWQAQFEGLKPEQLQLPSDDTIIGKELQRFIDWFNQSYDDPKLDPLLRAAISHLWMIVMQEFIGSSGKLTRTVTDFALAQANIDSLEFYSVGATILEYHKQYKLALKKTLSGTMDITFWLKWFLTLLEKSIDQATAKIESRLSKSRFWQKQQGAGLKEDQLKVLKILLDDPENNNGISASEYQKTAGVSKATATRHLTKLVEKNCLVKLPAGGRSTRYQLNIQN